MSLPPTGETIAPRWSLPLLALLVAAGIWLRVRQADESLWVDELHSAWSAGGGLAEVAPRAAAGNQSPLFYWLQWLVVQALGASEFTLRLPSLVAGSLLPAALYVLAWRWTRSSLVALVAAALVVFDPRSIFYATEARPYALVELLAVVHVAVFAELLARPSIRLRAAFVLGAALLFHLHYTAALLVPAEIACWLLVARLDGKLNRYRLGPLALDLFFLATLAAPAAWNVLAIAERRGNWQAFVAQQPAFEVLRLLPWTGAILFVLVDPDAFLRTATRSGQEGKHLAPRDALISRSEMFTMAELPLLLVLCWLLIPLGIAWTLTEADAARLFFPRYLVLSAPAAILLGALCTRLPPLPQARIALGIALVAYAVWSSGIIPQVRAGNRPIAQRREDWRSAVAWLNKQLDERPYPLLVRSGLIEADALRGPHDPLLEEYCLLPVASLYRVQADRGELLPLPYRDAGRLEPDVREAARRSGGAWIVIRGSQRLAENIERRIVRSLSPAGEGQAWQITRQRSFGNVQVALIVRKSNPPGAPKR